MTTPTKIECGTGPRTSHDVAILRNELVDIRNECLLIADSTNPKSIDRIVRLSHTIGLLASVIRAMEAEEKNGAQKTG